MPKTISLALVLATLAVLCVSLPASAQTSDDPAYNGLRAALETRTISIDFQDITFPEAIDDIRTRTGLNMMIAPSALEDVENELITRMTLTNMLVKNVLGILLDYVELMYTFRYGVIYITTPEDAYAGDTVLRIYDVRDLTFRIRNFPGITIRLRGNDEGGSAGPGLIWGNEDEEIEPPTTDDLADLIPEFCAPESWDVNPDAVIMQTMGMLIVRQSVSTHAEIQRFLALLRANR